jgi:hypothetical protein
MVLVALFFLVPLTVTTIVCYVGYVVVRWWLDAYRTPQEAVAELGMPDGGRRPRFHAAGPRATSTFVEEHMTRQKDISDRLERLPAFEERAGVHLEALFAEIENEFLSVNGELHPREGNQLSADIELVVTAHDAQGRVLKMETASFDRESFFQFEPFSVVLEGLPSPPARIRIYPKPLAGSEG